MNNYTVHIREGFQFVDEGPSNGRVPVVLLHGMLGALGNWAETIAALAGAGRRVLAPMLPVYDLPDAETSVTGLMRYTARFTRALGLDRPVLVGNSLGGHVALLYALKQSEKPTALVLAGASGLEEMPIGVSTPRRFDREYVKARAALTFHDPAHVSDELVDGVMEIVADRNRVKRLIRMARSAREELLEDAIARIQVPTMLIWGTEDRLTPPAVAHRFRRRLSNARLELIAACGHAPMIEQPRQFNEIVIDFLSTLDRALEGKPIRTGTLPENH